MSDPTKEEVDAALQDAHDEDAFDVGDHVLEVAAGAIGLWHDLRLALKVISAAAVREFTRRESR